MSNFIIQDKEEAEKKEEAKNSGKSAQFIRYFISRFLYKMPKVKIAAKAELILCFKIKFKYV